jgi:hypothetical protein
MNDAERDLWEQRVKMWRGMALRFAVVVVVESAALIALVLFVNYSGPHS